MSEEQINGRELQIAEELPLAQRMPTKDLDQALVHAEKMVRYMDRLIKIAVSLTNRHDWVDQNGTPYLQETGSAKIARGFGMQIHDRRDLGREEYEDEKGKYYVWKVQMSATWQGSTVTEIGVCSSRDKFFGVRGGNYLPLSEIDTTNMMKKAQTNCLNRLTKRTLGLSFTWEEIEEASAGKIKRDAGPSVSYDHGKRGGNTDNKETKERKAKLRKAILDMCGGDVASAREWLKSVTTFEVTNPDGSKKTVEGKTEVDRLTEKQVPRVEKALEKKLREIEEAVRESGEKGVEA